jgi:GDPmannose 4,6-dehydratase
MARVYRESYGMFVSCGILFNHESEHRGRDFVTRKITATLGANQVVRLGNMDARRDWGFAGDYTRAMTMMLRHDEPDDFVIATGTSYSVREFYEEACKALNLDPALWVEHDPAFNRPVDVHNLIGDASKAREVLGWEPSLTFSELVARMAHADV